MNGHIDRRALGPGEASSRISYPYMDGKWVHEVDSTCSTPQKQHAMEKKTKMQRHDYKLSIVLHSSIIILSTTGCGFRPAGGGWLMGLALVDDPRLLLPLDARPRRNRVVGIESQEYYPSGCSVTGSQVQFTASWVV